MADKNTKVMSLSVKPEMQSLLKVSAKQVGCSVSELVRRLVDRHLELVTKDDDVIPVILKIPSQYKGDSAGLKAWLDLKVGGIVKALVNDVVILPIEDVPKEGIEDASLDTSHFRLCYRMAELCSDTNGIGLAAVQVGVPSKIFVVRGAQEYEFYLNCDYTPLSDEMTDSIEGCLSITHRGAGNVHIIRHFLLRRYRKIRITGKQLTSDGIVDVDRELEGMYSTVFQHEIDHQKGVSVDMLGEEVSLSAID